LTPPGAAAILRVHADDDVDRAFQVRGETEVGRLPFVSLILMGVLAVAACGGGGPAATPAPTAAPTIAITEPPVSAKPGKPVVTIEGAKVHVEGIGVGNSEKFELTGKYAMSITACKATGVTPFIVLRSAETNLAPTYVDTVTHLTNLKGKYDVEITPAPNCAWAVDFVPE
jgi:hypothetical protein